MRKQYVKVFKVFLQQGLYNARADLGLSQEQMAERMEMSSRCYVNLEHGKSSCSGLTLALYLIYGCNDPVAFLEDLRRAFENAYYEVV